MISKMDMDLGLSQRIEHFKKEQNAVIAAHTYQAPEVQAAADIIGDSYALAQKAAQTAAGVIYMCGVRFMAEGVKILSPDKKVVLVEPSADCAMARQISPERVQEFRRQNPDYAVVAYINTTAELKAVCDVCVTSSSAVRIVRALPQKNILFIPDQNLGKYVHKQVPEKHIVTWDGYCPVHHVLTAADIMSARQKFPHAKVAIHPECKPEAVAQADMVGSTADIIRYIESSEDEILVATERGVADRYSLLYPGRIHQICAEKLVCPDMKRTTLDSVMAALEGKGGEVIALDDELAAAARSSLENMLKYGG